MNQLEKIVAEQDDKVTMIFEALSDPGRFKVFKILVQNQGVCVTDMARLFKVTPSAISQRMKMLEMTGLVRRKRFGQMICYEVKKDDPLVKCVMKSLKGFYKK